jgi:hypothetical protein
MGVPVGQKVTAMPAGLAVAAGRFNELALKGTSGLNEAVGSSHETIAPQGGLVNTLTSAEVLKVSSADTNDTNSGGTGARRVRLIGIDDNGEEAQEDVLLNGTGVVSTTTSFQHINQARVQKAGSGGVNAGKISIFANDGTTLLQQISAGENQTQQATYAVPTNKKGYLTSFMCSSTEEALISIWVSPNPAGVPYFQKLTTVVTAGSSNVYQLPNPFPIPSGGRMEFRAKKLGSTDAKVSADFQMLVEDD